MRRFLTMIAVAVGVLATSAGPASAAIWTAAPYLYFNSPTPSAAGFDGLGQWYCTGNDPRPAAGQVSQAWYYATSNIPIGNTGGGYFGLQTDSGGKRAIFSIWGGVGGSVQPGGTSERFVEDGAGWHILYPYNWVAGDCYFLYILRGAGGPSSWDFWIFDNNAQVWTPVGEILMPDSHGIGQGHTDFVEWYGPQASSCSLYPRADIYFYPATYYIGGTPYQESSSGHNTVGGCPITFSQGPGLYQHIVIG